jgi:hypothetical protein
MTITPPTDDTPLTDEEFANIRDNLANADKSADPWEIVPNYRAVRGLLAEVDRLRAELAETRRVADEERAELMEALNHASTENGLLARQADEVDGRLQALYVGLGITKADVAHVRAALGETGGTE